MKFLRRVLLVVIAVLAIAWFVLPGIVENRMNKVLNPPPYHASAAAQSLHKKLLVADLHADSLLWKRNLLERSSRGEVDLPRLQEGNVAIQAFTLVTTSPRGLNIYNNSDDTDQIQLLAIAQGWPPPTWNSPKMRALYEAAKLHKFAHESGGTLVVIQSKSDLRRFLSTRTPGQVAGFLGTEGSQPLEGKLDNLDDLFNAGIRMMAPTHFTDTAVGGAAAGMKKGGLTQLGKQWVHELERRGIIIDLAHSSPATLRDVTSIATRPLFVSHTGVKGTCNNPRNLSDDELRMVAKTGGVIGIGLWDTATCGTDARATARAIKYAVGIVGVDHIGLGSDFDGAVTTPFDASGWALVTDALLQEGFSEQDIHKIMGENVARVLLDVLPN
ncbi:MAG TPA: membrane dipeptidase [Candidatus Angelobacter sp.]|jgi:microsomal dipeptidase-like Zn-dependent dipeptidase|nr:membrane dipeptidase [Candidatus Angelobacter sp.]